MKLLLIVFAALSLCACGSQSESENVVSIDLTGKSFSGAPETANSEPQPGCEGCGNPGSIEFLAENRLSLARPGDDQVFMWTYVQIGNQITTENGDIFVVSPDGLELTTEFGIFSEVSLD